MAITSVAKKLPPRISEHNLTLVAAGVAFYAFLALVPALLFACLASAHAITYMDLLYYYVRLPFVAMLAFYGLEGLAALAPADVRPRALAAARVAALLLCFVSLGLTALLLA